MAQKMNSLDNVMMQFIRIAFIKHVQIYKTGMEWSSEYMQVIESCVHYG
jgi:hypothetical protein